jgi:hypothetical protein
LDALGQPSIRKRKRTLKQKENAQKRLKEAEEDEKKYGITNLLAVLAFCN